ncbi:hypothetical protein [Proteus mirabilis]|uniref:hypothetical protein n=1 Tax=Proteus mirabilis TaxID=584 RepID=UPI00280C846C|nr:hypothetical protein [Proteus mirabilis]HEK1928042.1 hypothetical protein [Proteus mirabilis]
MTENTKLAIDIARKLRTHLTKHHGEIAAKYNFMLHQFPVNSCEPSSILLGGLLSEYLNSNEVFIIKVDSNKIGGMHFFVEFENLYYDLTSDQFEFIDNVIIAEDKESLFNLQYTIEFKKNFTDFIIWYCEDAKCEKRFILSAIKEVKNMITPPC